MDDNQNATSPQPEQPQSMHNIVQPSQPQPSMGGNVYVGSGPGGTARPMPSRKRLFMIAGAATVLVLGTGAYVLGYYVPNRPANVFKSALNNTADGYDSLLKYADNQQVAKKFDNSQIDGNYKLDSSSFTTDGSFSAHMDQKNASFSGDLGLGTTRVKLDGLVKSVSNSQSPDAYLKVSGIKGFGDQLGMPALDTLDNQWISIDHSFFDNLMKQAQQAQSSQDTSNMDNMSMTTPSEQDLSDAAKAVGAQARKYLFSTDSSTAVFQMDRFVGKETVDGKDTNHYKVSANKDHLKAFVAALGDSLDKTKLNDWAKQTYGKPLSQVIDVDGMKKSVDNIKSGDTFDLWVNTKTRLVHKVRISEKQDPTNNYFEFGLNYNGGAEKPIFINVHTKQDGVTTAGTFGVNLNTDTNVIKVNLDINTDQSGDTTKITLNATAKPATGSVDVTPPTGAITLNDALNRVGLGGYLDLLTQGLSQGVGSLNNSGSQDANPFTVSL